MTLTRIINKTPLTNEKCNVYEIDNVDANLINQITQSRFAGDGVFCIEQLSMSDYKEGYLITPSFCKESLQVTDKEWNFKSEDIGELTVFEMILDKPSFMPLDNKQFIDLLNGLSAIPNVTVFSQVLLCKRLDNWRENSIQQYTSYLNGNDYPVDSKIGIKFQGKVLNILNKISNFTVKRDPIDEMEQKILSYNYRFECRFIVYEQKYVNNFVESMEKNLKKLTFFNEFRLKKAQNKRKMLNFIENREFSPELVNQMLSEMEIYSLLCSNKPSTVTKIELEKPVKQQGIVKSIEDSMLIQNAIKLMPFSENKNIEIDQSKAEQINQAFKRVGIVKKSLKITDIHQGSTLLKVEMKIPPEITYTTITKKLTDIKAALGNEGVSIEISNKPDTINVFLPLENRGVVYFRSILESESFQNWCKTVPLPFIIGESVNGELLFSDLADLPHLLIAGATKSGKSVFTNLLILSLILNVPPNELSLYLIDPKQVEYSLFDGFPQVRQIITDMKKADALLLSLVNEMEKRYELFAKSGVKNIATYNKNNENKIPYIVTAIDEYADLVMVNPNVEDHLVRLCQKARASGIHLIICTQKPLADIVTSVLKSNLPSAISFRLKTSSDYQTVFGKGIPYNLLGKGDGVCRLEGQLKEYERFQSPVLTLNEEDEEGIYNGLKALFKDVVVEDMGLPESESELDKLKRIIANTNELRVSELQSKMGIAIGKVTDLLKQLLDEGWLRREGRSYVINVDQDELDKWKESSA
jgi:S-DNA-T family DNA segregation ATPase FtsK/SpoIIIE